MGTYGCAADLDLLALADAGEGRAFGELYHRHRDRVFRHLLRRLESAQAAEDATATVFLIAWERRAHIRVVDNSIAGWLLVTASHVAQNERRFRSRYRRFLNKLPRPSHAADHSDDVGAQLDLAAQRPKIERAFVRLHPRDQEILALCVLDELSTAAVSALLQIPPGTVKSRLSRAKRRLSENVKAELEQLGTQMKAMGGAS